MPVPELPVRMGGGNEADGGEGVEEGGLMGGTKEVGGGWSGRGCRSGGRSWWFDGHGAFGG